MINKKYVEERMRDLGLCNSVVGLVGENLNGLPQVYADSVIDMLRATYIDQRTAGYIEFE